MILAKLVERMQVDRGVLDVGVSEQQLNGAEIRSGFQQMSRIGVAKRMGSHALLDVQSQTTYSNDTSRQAVGPRDRKRISRIINSYSGRVRHSKRGVPTWRNRKRELARRPPIA